MVGVYGKRSGATRGVDGLGSPRGGAGGVWWPNSTSTRVDTLRDINKDRYEYDAEHAPNPVSMFETKVSIPGTAGTESGAQGNTKSGTDGSHAQHNSGGSGGSGISGNGGGNGAIDGAPAFFPSRLEVLDLTGTTWTSGRNKLYLHATTFASSFASALPPPPQPPSPSPPPSSSSSPHSNGHPSGFLYYMAYDEDVGPKYVVFTFILNSLWRCST